MQQTPTYIVVRDTDIEALEETVNARIEEGYDLAGPLVCVPSTGASGPMFMQPLTLSVSEDDEDDDEDANFEDVDIDESEESSSDDIAVVRRGR